MSNSGVHELLGARLTDGVGFRPAGLAAPPTLFDKYQTASGQALIQAVHVPGRAGHAVHVNALFSITSGVLPCPRFTNV